MKARTPSASAVRSHSDAVTPLTSGASRSGSTTSSSSRSSPGPWSSARYSGDDASSSSWVPLSATRPSATSTMRSARRRVERRWAMSTVVRSAMISRSVAWICSSVRVSTDDVASSSTSTRGSVSTARAMEMRWR